jgi:hypothetical protein
LNNPSCFWHVSYLKIVCYKGLVNDFGIRPGDVRLHDAGLEGVHQVRGEEALQIQQFPPVSLVQAGTEILTV